MDKKKKTRRSKIKYPNLIAKYNSRVRQEFLDVEEYLHLLNEEELNWLNKFIGEYNNGSVVLDENNELDRTQNIHQNPENKKELFDKNNRQNRDMYGNVKAKVANTKLLNYEDNIGLVEQETQSVENPRRLEDAFIDYIESQQIAFMMEEYDNAMLSFKEVIE